MKRRNCRIVFLICLAVIAGSVEARDLGSLKALYIGDKGSAREKAFTALLNKHVAAVGVSDRTGFDTRTAASYDVVLLDWPQRITDPNHWAARLVSPLGAREKWTKPTVLLGSAGLNLAIVWELKGGAGCTCMDPLAYGLRDHPIFETPFKIDRTRIISIPTPPDFAAEIKESTIHVLPLVDDISAQWKQGWCTYDYDFSTNPDVEFFCGGVNHKTPGAAGLWRQGNLLHFGFEQSPDQMNATGNQLLLNAIAYISQFSEDRPIAFTPSPFLRNATPARATVRKHFADPEWQQFIRQWISDEFTPEVQQQLEGKSQSELVAWADVNGPFLHRIQDGKLELDQDLIALKITFEHAAFLDVIVQQLRGGEAEQARGRRLLERYVPDVPKTADADAVEAWVTANRPYLFATDTGDYRWYVDPLAKRRAVASSQLRGPARADAATRSD